MQSVCFVPVIGYVANTEIHSMMGYEIWLSHPNRTTPYILELSVEEYAQCTVDKLGGQPCKVYDFYVNIPPLALYSTEEEARAALGLFAPLLTKQILNTTR